jgi:hypothetical protein
MLAAGKEDRTIFAQSVWQPTVAMCRRRRLCERTLGFGGGAAPAPEAGVPNPLARDVTIQGGLLAERANFRRRVLPLIRRSSRIPRWPSEALGMNLPGVDDQAGRLALDALHVSLGDLGGG